MMLRNIFLNAYQYLKNFTLTDSFQVHFALHFLQKFIQQTLKNVLKFISISKLHCLCLINLKEQKVGIIFKFISSFHHFISKIIILVNP